ncbi:hypothetical protein ACG92W_07845 [Acinetobacter ursingii]|uniref:hypothetical protein n=1 Tax=Acinetobacter ursingii TaxID=108980 RepID=UPI003AF7A2C1
MDTVEERSENLSFDDQIKIVNDLEQYIFEKIYSSLEFRSKIHNQIKLDPLNLIKLNYTIFDKSLLCQSFYQIQAATPLNFFKPIHDKILKTAIYILHDQGMFKESDEDRVKRLCKDSVQVPIPCKKGDNKVEKLDFEYLPKHYHEIIQGIKNFRSDIETKNYLQANITYTTLFQEYSEHRDCYIFKVLPESFQNKIDKIQKNKLSKIQKSLKKNMYISFVTSFIKKYENKTEQLWDEIGFTSSEKRLLKNSTIILSEQENKFKSGFSKRSNFNESEEHLNKIYDLLNLLIEHINDLAEKNVKEKIKEYYDSRISSLQVQIDNINYILQQKFISPQKNNLLNHSKSLYSKKKLTPKQTLKLLHLFEPNISVHQRSELIEIRKKRETLENKYQKKVKEYREEAESNHNSDEKTKNYFGNTQRILTENEELYLGLCSLLKCNDKNDKKR